jgi:hypothetical protein
MGYTHCFRANAAYSLYGVLKGHSDDGCTSGTYINSFFTNYGVDAFEPVMEAAGLFSEGSEDLYTAECQDGDDDDGNDADGRGYGGGTAYANKGDNMGSTSYGMSCDGTQFVTKKFRGRYCDGKDEIKITDLLESFNEAIVQVECVQVYSGSSSNDDDNNNNNNNGNDGSIASELLSSSKACSIREYPVQCPDPHGKLLKYTRALECATGSICLLRLPEARLGRDITSIVLLGSGLAMIGAALCCKWHRRRGKAQMDLIRESSDASKSSNALFLSKVSSSLSQASAKVVDAIQDFAEAEAPGGMGVTVAAEMEMAASDVSRSGLVSGSPSTVHAAASNVSPNSTSFGVMHTASGDQTSVGFNEATQTPTRNVAFLSSAAEAIDSTPSTVATFQSIQSAEDRKKAATNGPPTYGPPLTRAARSTDDEAIAHMRIDEVANNMVADKASGWEMEEQKSYKRPTLARISKRLFGGRKKKINKKFEH